MTAYVLGRVEVSNQDRYNEYMKKTPGIIAEYGGKFIVRGGEVVTLEGDEETRRLVVIEFPSLTKAKEFYHSSEYQEAKKLREGAACAQFLAVDGVD